jgi:hypothetical protein
MAAVLQPWLGNVLLAEASLALLWHFHGIRFQNARNSLIVSDKPIERFHEIVIASSQSSRALQVLSTVSRPILRQLTSTSYSRDLAEA